MRLRDLALSCLIGLAGPSHSQDLYDLLNTPRMDPCALFEGNDDVVTFYIDMDIEGGEVEMRVPKIFLEDRFDHEDGVRHGSQLFNVMIDNFLPVTRRQTSKFNKARIWERGYHRHMRFLVGDYVDLNEMAEHALKRMIPGTPELPVSEYDFIPFEHDLMQAVPFVENFQRDVFLAYSPQNDLHSVISCSADGTVNYPSCKQFFRSNGMDVRLSFQKPYLSEWKQMRDDVDRFLNCTTDHTSQ